MLNIRVTGNADSIAVVKVSGSFFLQVQVSRSVCQVKVSGSLYQVKVSGSFEQIKVQVCLSGQGEWILSGQG